MVARITALSIIKALGGNETTGMCRCPSHNDKTPSLKVSTGSNGKVLVHCKAGCLQDAVIAALKARGLWHRRSSLFRPPTTEETPEESSAGLAKEESLKKAREIWQAASPDDAKRLAPYFEGRGITSIPHGARWLSASQASKLTGRHYPAMVLQIVNSIDKFQGVQVLWLSRDGTTKLNTAKPRRNFGSLKGGYIKLGIPDPKRPLILAEGVENAMSASQFTLAPAIAALANWNLKFIKPPP
jgi:putative DNA primase/helicase